MRRVPFAVLLATFLSLLLALPVGASYSPGPLPSHWWAMTAGTGSTLIDSAGGDTATFNGAGGCSSGPQWSGVGLVTGTSQSLKNSCSSNVWADPATTITVGTQWTVSAWWSGNCGCQMGLFDTEDGTHGLQIYINSGGGMSAYDGTLSSCSGTNAFTGGVHFLAATRTSTSLLCYFDGALITTAADSTVGMAAATCTRILAFCGAGGPYGNLSATSYVGELAVFPYAMTTPQIAAAYASGTAAPAAASTLTVDPKFPATHPGYSLLFQFSSTDASGNAVPGNPYSFVSSTPAGGVASCAAFSTTKQLCTAGAVGIYDLKFSDSLGNFGHATLFVLGNAASFNMAPAKCNTTVGGTCEFRNVSGDASGNDVSSLDAIGLNGSLPSGVTCGGAVQQPAYQTITCSATSVGTYTIGFSDLGGLTTTADLVVGAAVNPSSCGPTDVGCWVGTLVQSVLQLGRAVADGLYTMFFVSHSGRNFVDLSGVTGQALLPGVACRSGQTPTHPDGTRCLPFPFSIPADLGTVLGTFVGVTPTPPTFSPNVPLTYRGVTYLTISFTLDPSIVLTPTIMTYIRAIELVTFVVALGIGTYRFVQAWGAG